MAVNRPPPDTANVPLVRHRRRRLRTLVVTFLTALGLVTATSPTAALLAPPPPELRLIVQLWDGDELGTIGRLQLLGGVVTDELPVVNGVAVTATAAEASAIAGLSGVRAVSLDVPVLTQAGPVADGGLDSVHREVVGATAAQAAGQTGAGANVAVIDTGIADVPALAGSIVPVPAAGGGTARCVNFSDEPGCGDSYGHGTFVAGLVHDVAPGAGLVSVKLSGRDGTSSVSRLLKALGWVITFQDALDIEVVNLSLRTYSPLSYRIDPVNFAVERAWASGLTVVVSAGNQGPAAGSIAKPADDPWVITVGSTDDQGTVSLDDDVVSSFSARGPSIPDGVAKPDVVVPGRSLVGLRSPGSEADLRYPTYVDAERRRGSGTSFSAPLVSGAAAVLAAADPSATNDRIKFALAASGRPVPGASAAAAGAGTIDVASALSAPAGLANQDRFHPLFAAGAVASLDDVARSVFEASWLGGAVQGSNWQGSNWQGSNWQGSNWQGSNWQGSNWQGSNWQGSNWQGSNWQGSNWQGSNWQGSNWQGSNWQGSNWQGSNWQGSNWQGSNWQGSNWQGSNWQGSNWQAGHWS
jgi:serine protease AprX